MTFRLHLALAAALGLMTAPGAVGQTLRYEGESGASHVYSRIQEDHVRQMVGGQEQKVDIRSHWRFSARVAQLSPETLTFAIVHDSIAVTGNPAGDPDFSALYGKPVRIVLDRRGEVRTIELPDSLPAQAERLALDTTYRTFFPVLPADAVETGTTWADTTELSSEQNGLVITVQRVNTYTARGEDEYAGGEGLRVDYVATLALEGSGSQQGAAVSLSGGGQGSGSFYFDVDGGRYLGGSETTEVKMDAFVAAGGQNLLIPIITTRSETVALIE